MKRVIVFICVLSLLATMFTVLPVSAGTGGFQVSGTSLLDANGNQFIMRGINHAHTWYKDQLSTVIPVLAKAGCNTVRIVLSDGDQWTLDDVSSVKNIISLCEQNKMIAVLEVHDALGVDTTQPLLNAANYFVKIKDALIGKEDRVIVNIANEWVGTWSSSVWSQGYQQAIPIIRNAGIKNTIMVDAAGWGQYGQAIIDNGQAVFAADTLKNTMFSIHMYSSAGKDATTIKNNIDGVLNKGLCLVIGEFGFKDSYGDIDESTILSYCQQKSVGWMAWSWKGNSGGVEYLDLSNDWAGTSLTDWGNTVINGTNGLKATSKICSVFGGSLPSPTPTQTYNPNPTPTPTDLGYDFNVVTSFTPQKLVANQMMTAKVVATNVSATPYTGTKDVLLIVALYDANNTMQNVSYISKGIPYQGTENLSAGFKLPSNVSGYSVRAFMWDGVDLKNSNMTPLSNVTEVK